MSWRGSRCCVPPAPQLSEDRCVGAAKDRAYSELERLVVLGVVSAAIG